VCVAGSRILVERPIYEEFVDRFAQLAKVSVLGDPLDPATQIGPIANRKEYEKILGYIESGKETARLAAGGGVKKINGKGYFIEATVFADAINEIKIAREEIFAPVVPVIPFDTEEDAIRIANDTPYGLAAWSQTSDIRRTLRLAD
jgi:aldehyde dehydrogenase (NAD+)